VALPASTAAAAAIDQYLLPSGPTAANLLLQQVCCCGLMLKQTIFTIFTMHYIYRETVVLILHVWIESKLACAFLT